MGDKRGLLDAGTEHGGERKREDEHRDHGLVLHLQLRLECFVNLSSVSMTPIVGFLLLANSSSG